MGANDIAIVEDMEDFRIGDYLGAKPCLIQGLSHQHPALKSSVRPDKPEERSKVISALNTLWIEDPSLSFSINLSLIHISCQRRLSRRSPVRVAQQIWHG